MSAETIVIARKKKEITLFPPPSTRAKIVGISMAVFAAFGGCLYGYDTGYISGMKEMKFWLRTYGDVDESGVYYLSTAKNSVVTSILSVGTFVGALLASPLGDITGRRWGVIASCLVICMGVMIQATSTSMAVFATGRIFSGLGVGLTSTLVPMYQSECAPKWIRGAIVSCYQLAVTIGLLIAALVVNATKDRADATSYQIPIILQSAWATILAIGLFCLPESPKYLILKERKKEAGDSIGRLLSLPTAAEQVVREYEEVAYSLLIEKTVGTGSYADCFKSGKSRNRLRTLSGMAIQGLQQASGFFKNCNMNDPFVITIIITAVNVVMTLPGIYAVDRIGRRKPLLLGGILMFLCELVVGILGKFIPSNHSPGQHALIALVCIFIGSFALSWGPVVWVVTGEIFPLTIRAKAMSLSTASSCAVNFAVGYATPFLVYDGPGNAGLGTSVFFIWSGFCALGVVFTFLCIPETKGLSLEEVNEVYQNSTIIGSDRYRKQLLKGGRHRDPVDSQETVVIENRNALPKETETSWEL